MLLTQSLLPDEAFMKLLDQAFTSGLWHKLAAGRPYDELADFLTSDDYAAMAALADPAVGGASPSKGQPTSTALQAKTGPGPGYERGAALDAVRTRYARMLPMVRFTLARLGADPVFQRTAARLREQGWRDWHLLTAIVNLVGNRRIQRKGLQPALNDSAERLSQLHAVMTASERPEDPPVPVEAFTESALHSHLHTATLATVRNLDLVIRRSPVDPQALLSVLGDRYGYWKDDVDHPDLFGTAQPRATPRPDPAPHDA
ncbi:hypothetical protein ACWDAO_02310 [Streptomyces sp. NPDC001212]|uniref:hypothetical protein n=1 Tax=Streptomyces sp. NPDC001312 TaxID=3364561 RepID=UPI00368A4A79